MDKYKIITIKELNLLYLEYKYSQVTPSTYGTYQFRAKIINEFMGDLCIANIDYTKIYYFNNYLYYRKWEYKENISKKTINEIMNYLYVLINIAQKWNLIGSLELIKNIEVPQNINKNFHENRDIQIKSIELKNASNVLNGILFKNL